MRQVFTGAAVFDGAALHHGAALLVEDGHVAGLWPEGAVPERFVREGGARVALDGGILAPGLLDLQVNGGGGVMFGAAPDAIDTMLRAHAALGTTGLLPTLITDTPEVTHAALAQGIAAAQAGRPGFLGLHLEGPHLDPRRKGAHDPALIRPMQPEDLALLCDAARALPALIVTLAPENATLEQIAALARAGVIVSLGHSDCDCAQAKAAFAAGARAATHLYNAMSPLGHRAPGLVGAVLDTPGIFAGIIADGVHVAPEALRLALAGKRGGGLYLVTDAMAVAGSGAAQFTHQGRTILRREGRLTLPDGTLAGADCTLTGAMAHVVGLGLGREAALAMATSVPAALIGAADRGHLRPGARADMVHLGDDLSLRAVWQGGAPHA
jgi:N-acetylglucosamine-6-phosphate deacetylase